MKKGEPDGPWRRIYVSGKYEIESRLCFFTFWRVCNVLHSLSGCDNSYRYSKPIEVWITNTHHYFERIHLYYNTINKLWLPFYSKDDISSRNFLRWPLAKTTFKDMSAKLTTSVLPPETVPCEVFRVLCVINSNLQYDNVDCIKPMIIFKKEFNEKIYISEKLSANRYSDVLLQCCQIKA
jgi:hypothetical protein